MVLRGAKRLHGHTAAGGRAGPQTHNSGLQVQGSAGKWGEAAPRSRTVCVAEDVCSDARRPAIGTEAAEPCSGQAPEEVVPLESGRPGRAQAEDGAHARSSMGKNSVILQSQFGHERLRTNWWQ